MSQWTPQDDRIRRDVYAQVRREEDICWLCNRLIDKTLKYPHPRSFSVDHIILASIAPELALERTNLHAAHLDCNRERGRKSAREYFESKEKKTLTSREW